MTTSEERSMLAKRALRQVTPSMEAIADEIGVAYSTVRAWNAGHRVPSAENLARLADAIERRGGELQRLADEPRRAAGG